MIPMRTDLNTGGFTLYEIMISITIVGIITGLLSVSLFPLLDRSEFVNTADQIKDSLRQAQWLALNRRESHRLKSEFGKLLLQRKNNGSYETVLEEKVPEKYQSAPHAGIHSVLSVLLQAELSHWKLNITLQKSWSVRLDESGRLKS